VFAIALPLRLPLLLPYPLRIAVAVALSCHPERSEGSLILFALSVLAMSLLALRRS
jgi:hypothetical protein